MKKYILLILSVFIYFEVFAQKNDISFYTDGMCMVKLTIQDDKIIKKNDDSGEEIIYKKDAIKLHSDGFYYFSSDDKEEIPIIFGDVFFGFYVNSKNPYKDVNNGMFEYYENNDVYYRIIRRNPPKIEYSSSSFLTEGRIIYEAKNLGKLMFPSDCIDSAMPYWNPKHKPWVEGVSGYGENEYIEIKSDKEFTHLQILNGYVDLNRFDLYKKNSRVKTFLVEDFDNKIKYDITLTDDVKFQDFNLEKSTKHIRLTIKDVYKGDKWDDTCVSSIIPY